MTAFPVIDYSQHPAFSNLHADPNDLSARLLPVFQEIDAKVMAFDDEKRTYSDEEIRAFYQQVLAPYIEQNLTRVISDDYTFNVDARQIMLTSIQGLIHKLTDQSLYKNVKKSNHFSGLSTAAQRVLGDLNEKGITTGRIDQKVIDTINKDIAPYREEVERMEKSNPHGRNYIAIPKRSRHWRLIEDNLNKSGFMAGASAFYGSNLVVTGCGLELSTERQTWWRDCYSDCNIPTVPCAYMHNDYDYDYVKSLVYLSEVEKEQGPFSYIPESHKWTREHSLSFFIKETEMNTNLYFKGKGLGKPNYYRRAMGIEEGRKVFYALPKLFQQLSHFGDDIMPDSPLNDQLMSREFSLTSDQGNFAFFTGGTGIHRGSNVAKGHRWAFQITLTREPDLVKKVTSLSRRLAGETMKSIVGERKMLNLQKKFKATF